MREQDDEAREEPERDVPRDVGAGQTEDRRDNEADESDADTGNERLSQDDPLR